MSRYRMRLSMRWLATGLGGVALIGLALAAAGWTPGDVPPKELRLVTIATGSSSGVYYYAGGVICNRINAGRWHHGIRCITSASNGSIDNLRAIRNGRMTFGIVQSDWLFHAIDGTGVFEALGPDNELRSLVSLYPESFTLVARGDAGIAKFEDLEGKRVNVGPAGSGSRATWEVVMQEMGWTESDFAHLGDLGSSALPQALCAGEMDAAVSVIAHPNLNIEEMLTSCNLELVPVDGPGIDQLVLAHPYYFESSIPAGTYPGQPATVPVFAVAATLVTGSATSPAVVDVVMHAIFDDLEGFHALHPAFADLQPDQAGSVRLIAPLHSGAARFYNEAGDSGADEAAPERLGGAPP
jgi:uncharacterized protein